MKNLYLALVCFFVLNGAAYAQSDSTRLAIIAARLDKQMIAQPVEKVYLHLNKPNYLAGDTIWFKGYVTVGANHQPSALSGILYVDLIDAKGKIVKTLRLKVQNSTTTGDIAINNTLPAGDYRLRAYTNWMRNAAPDYFFTQTINIGTIKTNAVYVTSAFDVSGKNKEGAINTRLTYTDKFGLPYDHKPVTYEVKADTTTLFKGMGITDGKGNLVFAFSDKAAGQKTVTITTHVKLFAGVTIDKNIPVNLKNEIDLQFFPEGGQLVNEVRSKVAFKCIGLNGLGVGVKGVILDNENNEVAYFSTQHAGMGIFAITPSAGKTYVAKVTLPDSSVTTVTLPQAVNTGIVLAVNNSDSAKLTVRIATNALTLQQRQNDHFLLVGQSGGKVYYTTAGKLDNLVFTAIIAKTQFPSGIAQFTLFSSAMEPLNERVAFIQNADQLNLELSAPKNAYAAREKVSLTLAAKGNQNKPAMGSFSLSVFNEDRVAVNEDAESSILSNILLTSDLKGYIEEPNYYFNHNTTQAKADLDVLMLTQGYRRFDWKAVIAGEAPAVAFEPEKSLGISGMLTTASGKPLAKGKVSILSVVDKVAIDTVSDENGIFRFPGTEFPDSTRLVIKARKANDGKNVNISLDEGRSIPAIFKSNIGDAAVNLLPPFAGAIVVDEQPDTTQVKQAIAAENKAEGRNLKEVTIKEKKVLPASKYNNYGTGLVYNLNMAQARNYNSVYDALEWKVPGVIYKNGKLYHEGAPINLALVNELEVDIKYLNLLDPADIESIAVSGNAVFVTTKSFAGTDTVRLKTVTIAAKKTEKPDQSNLWGSTRPLAVISGKKLEDYVSIVAGLGANVMGVKQNNGKLYDASPMVPLRAKALHSQPDDMPIPVIVDGFQISPNDVANLNADLIEDVKVVQGSAFKSVYGVSASNPNDKVIVVTTKQFAGTDIVRADTSKIKEEGKNINLKQINVIGRANAGTEIAPWHAKVTRSANLNGPGMADQVITGSQLDGCLTIGDCLQSKIPGIVAKNGLYYFAIHMAQSVEHTPPIIFIIDGQITSGVDMLNNVIVSTVQTIEVLKSTSYLAVYGQNASGGALVITTKVGNPESSDSFAFKSVPGVIYTRFNGFYKPRQFYVPKYNYTGADAKANDARTAIYWNPNLMTNADGNMPIEFYNSDVKGNYRAVVEGIDNDGRIGRYVYRYRVE
jgi:hypothetical protein